MVARLQKESSLYVVFLCFRLLGHIFLVSDHFPNPEAVFFVKTRISPVKFNPFLLELISNHLNGFFSIHSVAEVLD